MDFCFFQNIILIITHIERIICVCVAGSSVLYKYYYIRQCVRLYIFLRPNRLCCFYSQFSRDDPLKCEERNI